MNQIVNNPGIAQGFAALAQALTPNANDLISADMQRRRGGLVDAQAGTARSNTRLNNQEFDHGQSEFNARSAFSEIFAGADLSDPAQRQAVVSGIMGMGLDPQAVMQVVTGMSTYSDPEFAGPNGALGDIFVGTGVVGNYGQTQAGQEQGEQAAIDQALALEMTRNQALDARQNDKQDFDMLFAETFGVRPGGSQTKPTVVGPLDNGRISDLVDETLAAQFPNAHEINPDVKAAIMSEVIAQVEAGGSADVGAALAKLGVNMQSSDESWWPTGETNRVHLPAAPAPAQPPAPVASGANPSAPGYTENVLADGTKVYWQQGMASWAPLP